MMKKVKIIMSLFTLISSLFSCQAQERSAFRSVSADEFADVIADSAVVRLDVRTAEEYAAGHIEGAVLIDVLQDDFVDKARSLLPAGHTVALYCRSGRRSKTAARRLAEEGYDVVELSTGWLGWRAREGAKE
ncbi:MAG: rhodanese-like domain-containing protein [Prevotella sp.]|nr:rhodanese-like domain-containing protein [Prevotella sp.]